MNLPLADITVVDLSRYVSGPFCSLMLADMGANVISIENPVAPPARTRGYFPWAISEFLSFNRNKKSMTLNIRSERGKQILFKLLKNADVVLENYRPGTMEKLGLSYDVIKGVNPRIIYCSISGFGQNGPYRARAAWDPIIQAMVGIMSVTGEPNRPPVRIGLALMDTGTAMYAAYAITIALLAREKKGKGQRIDVAMFDSAASWMSPWIVYHTYTGNIPERAGSGWLGYVPYQVFETKDNYVFIGVLEDNYWRSFCRVLGLNELVNEPRFATVETRFENRKELIPMLNEIIATKNSDELLEKLHSVGIPCAPVNSIEDVLRDPQLLFRNMLVDVEYPNFEKVKAAGIPIKLSETPGEVRFPPPQVGQHTIEILKKLGYTDKEIIRLRSESVV